MNESGKNSFERFYKRSILAALLVLVLYFGGDIIFPILFGVFFSFALLGPSRWLEKHGFPRFLSAFLLVCVSALALGSLLSYISFEGYYLVQTLEEVSLSKRLDFIESIGEWWSQRSGGDLPNKNEAYNAVTKKVINTSGAFLESGFAMLQSTFLFLSLVPIYAVLFLTYREKVRVFLNNVFEKKEVNQGREMIEGIATMIQSYLTGLAIVVIVVGVLYAIGLSLLGLDFALLLALVTAVLIIVPYIGAILGAILPAAVALLTMDSWWYSVIVLAIYVFIQILEGYVLTPFIIGKNVNLNPLVIIIGMIVLGAVGGLLAIVLAIPIIASIKIIFSHIDGMKPYAFLMEQDS